MNVLIALLAALGGGTWVYTKFMRRTGNNTKNSLVSAGIVALIIFVVVFTIALSVDAAL